MVSPKVAVKSDISVAKKISDPPPVNSKMEFTKFADYGHQSENARPRRCRS